MYKLQYLTTQHLEMVRMRNAVMFNRSPCKSDPLFIIYCQNRMYRALNSLTFNMAEAFSPLQKALTVHK